MNIDSYLLFWHYDSCHQYFLSVANVYVEFKACYKVRRNDSEICWHKIIYKLCLITSYLRDIKFTLIVINMADDDGK